MITIIIITFLNCKFLVQKIAKTKSEIKDIDLKKSLIKPLLCNKDKGYERKRNSKDNLS